MKKYVVTQTIKDVENPGTPVFETKFSLVDRILREVENPNDLYLARLTVSESLDIIKCLTLDEKDTKDVLIDSEIFISRDVAFRKHIKLEMSPFTTLANYVNSSRVLNNHRPHWALPLSYINPTPSFVSSLFNPNAHNDLTGTTRRVNDFINDNFRQVKHTAIVFDGKSLFFTNPTMPDRDINTNLKIPLLRGETLYSLKKDNNDLIMKVLSQLLANLGNNINVYSGDMFNTYEFVVTESVARDITNIIISWGTLDTRGVDFSTLFNSYFNKVNKPVYVIVDKDSLQFGVNIELSVELQMINCVNPRDIRYVMENVGTIEDIDLYNSIKRLQTNMSNTMSSLRWDNHVVEFIPIITETFANSTKDEVIRSKFGTVKKETKSPSTLTSEEIDELLDATENQINSDEVLTPLGIIYYGLVNNFAKDVINNRPLIIAGKRDFGYTDANEPEWEEYMNYRFKDKTFIVFDRNLIPNDFEWIKSVVGECYDITAAGDVELIACTKGFMKGLERDLNNAYRLEGNDILNAWNELRKVGPDTTEYKDSPIYESIKSLLTIMFNLQPNMLRQVDCDVKPKDSGDEIGTSETVTLSKRNINFNGKEVEIKVLTPEDLERMLCFPNNDTFGTKCCQDTKEASVPKEERVSRQSKSVDKVLEILRDKTLDVIVMNTDSNISIDNGTINVDSDESFNGDISSLIHGDVKYYYIDSDHKEFKNVKNRLPNRLSDSRLTGYLLSTNAFDSLIRNSPLFVTTDFIEVNGNDAKSALFYNMVVTPTPKQEEVVKVSDTVTVLDNDLVMFFKYKCLEDRQTGLKKINNGIPLISVSSEDNTDENMIKFHKVCSDFVRSMGKKAIVDGKYYVSEDFFRTQFKDVDIIGYMLFPIELKFSN